MALWIARDKNQLIWLYQGSEPPKRDDFYGSFVETENCKLIECIYNDDTPELTWENSPKELVIKSE